MKKFLLGVVLVVLALVVADGRSTTPRDIKAEARQTVVQLVSEVTPGEWFGYCSAVKLSPHFLVTAAHCVENKTAIQWRDNYDGVVAHGEVAKVDADYDIALVRVHTVCPCAPLSRRAPVTDDPVMHIGFPMSVDINNLQVLTEGTYQGRANDHYDLTTAEIIYGNSGGGAFNERGELIGLTVAVVAASDGFTAQAIPHLAIITQYEFMIRFLDGF